MLFIRSKIQFLKANHNELNEYLTTNGVVYQVKDTIFESKSQHFVQCCPCRSVVYQVKDTIFESKSQPAVVELLRHPMLFIRSKIQFLKANHNMSEIAPVCFQVVYQVKDTIFESKSQQLRQVKRTSQRCLSGQRYNF